MLVLAAVAHAGTVCADGQSGCDYRDLAAAIASGDETLELQPGVHVAGLTVDHRVDLTALPDAMIRPGSNLGSAFLVVPQGSDSIFAGLVYDTDSQLREGPLLTARGSVVTVVDAVVAGGFGDPTSPTPGFYVEQGGTLELVSPRITGTQHPTGEGTVKVDGSTLHVVDGRFLNNTTRVGGAIWARDSDVTITNTRFEGNKTQDNAGNVLWIEGGTLTLEDSTVVGEFFGEGTEVELDGLDSLKVTGGSFEGDVFAIRSSAISANDVGTFDIFGTRFTFFTGGAVRVLNANQVTVEDAVFEGNISLDADGGGLFVDTIYELRLDGGWFCGNGSPFGGAVRVANCIDSCVVTHSVFQDNFSQVGGAIASTTLLGIDRSTFLGNVASNDGSAVHSGAAGVGMETSIVVHHRGGYAVQLTEPSVFAWNALFDNVSDHASFPIPLNENRLGVDVDFEPGEDDRCGVSVALSDDPDNKWLVDHQVGALLDLDDDGFTDDVDCDDSRADIHPEAIEGVADGIDQDCDGTELCPVDFDQDGFGTDDDQPSQAFDCPPTRGDCQDDDDTVFPGAPDPWYDGFDDDCSGSDDDQDGDGVPLALDCDDLEPGLGDCEVAVGGGCRTAPGSGWLGLLTWLVLRPRRSRVDGGSPTDYQLRNEQSFAK